MKTDEILATRTHKIIYQVGDTAVKVFDKNYPKTDVLNEALNQAMVEETAFRFQRFAVSMLQKTATGVSFQTISREKP